MDTGEKRKKKRRWKRVNDIEKVGEDQEQEEEKLDERIGKMKERRRINRKRGSRKEKKGIG